MIPLARAAARFEALSYPLSVMAMRGQISGPMSNDISNCMLSLTSPPVRWKSRGWPSRIGLDMDFGRETTARAPERLKILLSLHTRYRHCSGT